GDYGILTPNADVEALYTAIEPILLDEKIRQSYSDKSLQRVENFKITPILSQWETLFNQKFDN
ncbi:MAG: glycosyltransferase family 4 protein, partial [Leuconostoc gelidum]